jgi:2-polyprenyl-6-methoxyphenol hydroxylase-like FAD-dependent oxidoreductase
VLIMPPILPENRRNRRAVIIGGSMSGLFTAAFLQRIGWYVDVYERSPVELVGRGAGINLIHPELTDAMERVGADMRNVGIEIEKRIAIDRTGRVVGERQLRHYVTSWDLLQRLLRGTIDDVHYHLGRTFASVEQDRQGVRVHFVEGDIERADLLVGGDGIRSNVRAQMAPEVQPVYAGYFLWRGGANEADLSRQTITDIFPHVTFFIHQDQQVMGYPMAGLNNDLRPGHRHYNFGWYRVADAETWNAMCVDENAKQHEFSIPPPLVRRDLIEEMRADAERELPPPLRDCLQSIKQPFLAPIYDFFSPTIVFGRVALVGDAASTPRPHVAFGIAKAAGDAQALAIALDHHEDIDEALAEYALMRQQVGERTVVHSRRLGTQFGVDLKTDDDRMMSQLMQTVDGVLDWVAVPNFLRSS